jgi:pimeloyl-ACP methyl ester carboxylesterase
MHDSRWVSAAFGAAVCTILILILSLPAPASAAGPYQLVGTATSRSGHLVRTETTVQVGADPLDRFRFYRLVQDGPSGGRLGSILLLPPLGPGYSFYEQRDPSGGVGTSITEYLALRGFDVYGYSARFEGLPAGACEAGVFDCSVMSTWDIQSMVEDIAFVRSEIERLHPGTPVVAGGASLGGILAVAVANADPDDYEGVILWEGMLATPDPAVQALNQGYCAALEAQLAAGVVFDGFGTNLLKKVAHHAETNPDGLSPIPLFPPGLGNHEVLVLTLSVPAPNPVTMPVPGYFLLAGSLAENRFFFASEPRVFEDVERFVAYSPLVLVRDLSCHLAGLDDSHVAHLGDFDGAVLALGGEHGFGPYLADQAAMFGTADVTVRVTPGFGHIDHFMSPHHREFVERPIAEWARRVLGD